MSVSSLAQTPLDRRCVNEGDVRLIEIRFEDDQGRLPCRVVYRPEVESDTVGIVSWRGIRDAAACEAQADEVVDRLTGEGWACTVDDASDADGGPEQQLALADPGDEQVDDVPAETAPALEAIDEPARLIENPDVAPPPEALATRIQKDLGQLDTTLDGVLEAEIAGYGDLDGDDLDDALVLYSYTSPQPAHRQFLVAYLFDGRTYQLNATKSVGGNINGTEGATVEAIDGGVVHLRLKAFERGDPACCPSGIRHMAMALRDLEWVELDVEAPTR